TFISLCPSSNKPFVETVTSSPTFLPINFFWLVLVRISAILNVVSLSMFSSALATFTRRLSPSSDFSLETNLPYCFWMYSTCSLIISSSATIWYLVISFPDKSTTNSGANPIRNQNLMYLLPSRCLLPPESDFLICLILLRLNNCLNCLATICSLLQTVPPDHIVFLPVT